MADRDASRRDFLRTGALAGAGLLASNALAAAQEAESTGPLPEAEHSGHEGHAAGAQPQYPRDRPGAGGPVGSPTDRGRLVAGYRAPEEPPVPIEAPDLEKLPWKMVNGAKEFHLYCRHVPREFLPGLSIDVWGFNDSMPGPLIEVVEGDRVRFVVHNELPEPTAIHWHGLEMPNRFDGVGGLTQEPIQPGESFVYEFDLHQNGSFFYHSHGAMQEAIGMVGPLIIHPREAYQPQVDRDIVLVLQEWAILPGSSVPNTLSMEFNFFTINGRTAPYTTPIVLRLGERVRLRLINFSVIDHHPMHIHGVTFWVTGNEAGRIPESAWVPGNTVLVAVAQSRDIEFVANNPGDWPFHCHMFHHMMNSMASMVGMAGGHTRRGAMAGADMAASMGMLTRGPALSEELGPALGRGLGEQTGTDRTARTGPQMPSGAGAAGGGHAGHAAAGVGGMRGRPEAGQTPAISLAKDDPRFAVPGFPQDMQMSMYTEEQLRKIEKRETRGMRRNWYKDIAGLMTLVRILPDDLYRQVMEGDAPVPPGASVPGAGGGEDQMDHLRHNATPRRERAAPAHEHGN